MSRVDFLTFKPAMDGLGVCKAIDVILLESWTGEGTSIFIEGYQLH